MNTVLVINYEKPPTEKKAKKNGLSLEWIN